MMDKNERVMKWLAKDDQFRIFINNTGEMILKSKHHPIKVYKPKWELDFVIKWDDNSNTLNLWKTVSLQYGRLEWQKYQVKNIEDICFWTKLPVTQEMIDIYMSIVLARKLNE